MSGRPVEGAREEDEGVSSLLDVLRVGMLTLDAEGRVELWSPMAEAILGYSASEVLGTPYTRLLGHGRLTQRVRRSLHRQGWWAGILRVRHRDGHLVPLECRSFRLRDSGGLPCVLAHLVEAERVREVENDLAALDALFSSNALGVGILDREQRYVRVNEALARLDHYPLEQHLGRTAHDIFPRDLAREAQRVQDEVLATGRSAADLVMPSVDGRGTRSVSYSRITDRAGNVLGVSIAVMDVTEQQRALEKAEAARERLSLLDDVGVALGDLLDVRPISQALAAALVPRFADYTGVMIRQAVLHGGELLRTGDPMTRPLSQLGVAARRQGPDVDRMLLQGQDIAFERRSFFGRVLSTGVPHLAASQRELLEATYPGDPKVQAAVDLGIHSLMTVPLRARGIVLGLLVVSRAGQSEPFDREDLALATEIADRAGTSLDNARLYAREREAAVMLQRSLLPREVTAPPSVRVAYRYVPGAVGAEVGGDWFDVIPLAGGRVAFVVGDVTGHGLRAAATMGRLRTAVRTLAALDLRPEELLRRVNDLADDLSQGPDDPLLATCLYAVYDPLPRSAAGLLAGHDGADPDQDAHWYSGRGVLTLAKAGHVPPLLVVPGEDVGRARPLHLPSGTPLGLDDVPFESVELEVEEGSVLVLYTDGLVESRGEDIMDGVDRLCALLGRVAPGTGGGGPPGAGTLEDACDAVLATLESGSESDDVALLMAQLGGMPEGSAVSWTFNAEEGYAVRRARRLVRATLAEWGLRAVEDEVVLLVSELVTNALRYTGGPLGVRMVRGTSLLVEVSDPLPAPPRERAPTTEDEGGRGIPLVAGHSRRWGSRQGARGKTVWFEYPLP
ncbi:SpoIIE family protein phosphatase [Streptomyces sp. NPDC005438]|uniref:SpoIIE family protein phosphatase n=1 Tax=Streptomyces sp. NPDC005438 TaxID=3156880 RepID=UPI0033AA87FD